MITVFCSDVYIGDVFWLISWKWILFGLKFFDEAMKKSDESSVGDVSINLHKTFDKVPGVKRRMLVWIQNWPRGRKQRTWLNGCFSNWREICDGVTWRAEIELLTLLIHINDLVLGTYGNRPM